MKKYVLLPLLIIAVIVYVRLSFYTVDAAEYAYVTVLGKRQAIYDGANQEDEEDGAGLKFGWPWPILQVQRLDRRLQHFDLPPQEQLTHDPKGNTVDKILLLEAYVCWKISDKKLDDKDPVDLFVRRIGTASRAREILAPEINGKLGAAIGQMRMDDLVNAGPVDANGKTAVDVAVENLRETLLKSLHDRLRDDYGIELIDIRLRRFNHPANVRDSIFVRIRAERSKEAARYETDGELQASKITSEAEETTRKMLSDAKAKEETIKAEADIEANKIRNQAYSQDPKFYEFVKSMEKLQAIVGDQKTMLLLSTHRPMFEGLFQPPGSKAVPDKKKGDK